MSQHLIGPKDLEVIKANMGNPATEIAEILAAATGCRVTPAAINVHLARIRDEASLQSDASSRSIDNKVQHFIEVNTNEYLSMLDDNIHQINDMLHGRDPDRALYTQDGRLNSNLYATYSGLLAKQIKLGFDIRPSEDVVRRSLNINVDIPQEQLIEKYFGDYIKEKDNIKNVTPGKAANKVIDIEPVG
jgi:hypothetical protein